VNGAFDDGAPEVAVIEIGVGVGTDIVGSIELPIDVVDCDVEIADHNADDRFRSERGFFRNGHPVRKDLIHPPRL